MSKNLHKAEQRLEQATAALHKAIEEEEQQLSELASTAANDNQQAKKLRKALGSARGVETMFRNIYRVQMDLTSLADNKANMMISINGIIISIILASVAPKLDANPWLMVPTTLLLVGTMISLVFSILAAKPRVSHQPITLADLRHSEGNLLFFGNFANLSEADFMVGMTELIRERTTLYEAMMRDIHGLGTVLNKKFHLLQTAYTAFMIALVTGVTAFIAVFGWVLVAGP